MSRERTLRKSSAPAAAVPAAAARLFAPPAWAVVGMLVALTLIVQRHTLHSYFALDDFIMFQQAAGVRPWPPTRWGWLSRGGGVLPGGRPPRGPGPFPVPRRQPRASPAQLAPPLQARPPLGRFAGRGGRGGGALRGFATSLSGTARRHVDRRAAVAHGHARGTAARGCRHAHGARHRRVRARALGQGERDAGAVCRGAPGGAGGRLACARARARAAPRERRAPGRRAPAGGRWEGAAPRGRE